MFQGTNSAPWGESMKQTQRETDTYTETDPQKRDNTEMKRQSKKERHKTPQMETQGEKWNHRQGGEGAKAGPNRWGRERA